ncbi:tagaturonate reductase [Dinghuibacter silviterrae]|uniref:Tagaturonate reductase n=1 Tax=Dinghuibacter silviterrae TaxID=1539049 RepID=A0A4R8DIP0_9BACT|nr:tagaturonate reductase [Dinghuibacter silviterrae]TDW97613.1 tagaturonate reductase [Dinghuibacter silviterrae]
MKLSINELAQIPDEGVVKPKAENLSLPETVLQFGTGVLLRGLPDYFIDKANRQGLFHGRIVVVKSTSGGDAGAFDRQNSLYTLCIRGIEHGHKVFENRISSAISRVLSAADAWDDVLELARKNGIRIIISNTTEVGIQAVEEDIHAEPPASFPGKLLAFLYTRYESCKGSADGGLVIIPTELISDNGKKLKRIVIDLARFNKLPEAFLEWLDRYNSFCSSLVDRIVPGRPDAIMLDQIQKYLGYEDDLLLVCESYRLWAIEGDEDILGPVLSFAKADPGVVIAPSIEVFKELKLRLLNGTHTLSCGLAFLSGFDTVRDTMEDEAFEEFMETLALGEIAHAIPIALPDGAAHDFGQKVLDRFRNPYLEHRWINITLQYSSKMKLRVIPVLRQHYVNKGSVPPAMTKGFAAHILFMRPDKVEGGKYSGSSRGLHYPIQDDNAAVYAAHWQSADPVRSILGDVSLWDTDLTQLNGFADAVAKELFILKEKGGL